jgi:hypothetical protein
MTKVRSREECLSALQADSAWRKKEIALLKARLTGGAESELGPLLRCAVVMIYAHWEGFVKTACELYLTLINEMIERRSVDLSEHFSDLVMWKMFRQKGDHQFTKNPVPFLEVQEAWVGPTGELIPIDIVDTESNLSSKVLKRLTATIGIDYGRFATKEKLIDESLLKMRNQIAHGDRLAVKPEDYETIEREVRDLIDDFQQLIETCVQQEQYRATADAPGTAPLAAHE